jgi:hypothetical protein
MNRVKNLKWVVLTLILALVFPSCQKESNDPTIYQNDFIDVEYKLAPGECDVVTNLIAGQHIDVGEVHVTHDEQNMYVTYSLLETGWCLTETHLHIASNLAGIPQTKSGNPKVGRFEHHSSHSCDEEFTYTIPIAWAPGSTVVIAAHAVVKFHGLDGSNPGGSLTKEGGTTETAWGEGTPFPGNNWSMHFDYTLCFDDNGGGISQDREIAYAYAPEGSGINSECFLTTGISNKWGWQLGAFGTSYTFELWALPNTCDHSMGFHVGYVEVEFKGGNKIDVSYRTFLGYSLDEACVWISDEPWSIASPMVDPDDFPYTAYGLNGTMRHTFNIIHKGQIFLIAYAKVFGVIHNG